jgi:hypothetical protein
MLASIDLESLARRQNVAACDVVDMDLAQRTKLPLATSDVPLRDGAIAIIG